MTLELLAPTEHSPTGASHCIKKTIFWGDEHPDLPAKNDGPGVPGIDPSEKTTPGDVFWIGKRLASGND